MIGRRKRQVLGLGVLAVMVLSAAMVGPAVAAPPTNNHLNGPLVLPSTGASVVDGTTEEAGNQWNEPHGEDSSFRQRPTVWYRWTAPSAARVTIDVCDTDIFMVLAVYAKVREPNFDIDPFTILSELSAVGEGDQHGGCFNKWGEAVDEGAEAVLSPIAGRTYYFQIAGWEGLDSSYQGGDQGPFTLRLTPSPLPPTPSAVKLSPTPNQFEFGKLKRNLDDGTATLTIEVPGPGDLTLGGRGIKAQRLSTGPSFRDVNARFVAAAGPRKLVVKARGKQKEKLDETGKVTLRAKITFEPAGGQASTQTKSVTLKKAN